MDFSAVPGTQLPAKKTVTVSRERKIKPIGDSADESALFFDEKKVPVELILAPNSGMETLQPGQSEVIGEKITHRLAQRPGSYVVISMCVG